MKFSRKLHCGLSSAYHGTELIKHNKIYLPLPRPRTPPLPPALPPERAPARRRTPPARGQPARGPPARGPVRQRGPLAGGPPAHGASWECEIVPAMRFESHFKSYFGNVKAFNLKKFKIIAEPVAAMAGGGP